MAVLTLQNSVCSFVFKNYDDDVRNSIALKRVVTKAEEMGDVNDIVVVYEGTMPVFNYQTCQMITVDAPLPLCQLLSMVDTAFPDTDHQEIGIAHHWARDETRIDPQKIAGMDEPYVAWSGIDFLDITGMEPDAVAHLMAKIQFY